MSLSAGTAELVQFPGAEVGKPAWLGVSVSGAQAFLLSRTMPDSAEQQSSQLCCLFVQRVPLGFAGKTFSASDLTSHPEKKLSPDSFLITMPQNSASVEFSAENLGESPMFLGEVERKISG